ncbi:MAG: Oxidoreductase, short-chain dehydrogenase/reductase family (EC [uncultured Thiotrichaceae bacterium]|uniref:Oxidoreductase, short-chain dehydrogenase/reductase family (EC) n=1 Tax=uncultured Thiotrichaceae bacterium TaxID=298394 RepID=A0A6S6SDE6_9GAMM|nr:MAG: Oxidoreductase, short-chain dehydrogenase/reductase family (EC [uncultured Thiotrichaceae bacterium]
MIHRQFCVVITGASSGLGAALARQYASDGVALGLIARNVTRLEVVADECRSLGAYVETIRLDVTDQEACASWFNEFDSRYPIDLCIANAAVTNAVIRHQSIEDIKTMHTLLATNVGGVLNTLHAAIPNMQKRQRGQLVIISSLAAFRGLPITPSYCASKSAISAYAEALRANLAGYNVSVSIAYPGFIQSPLSEKFPGNKPFMISADRAASNIISGIAKKRARIIFPYILYVGISALKYMPSRWGDWILKKISF